MARAQAKNDVTRPTSSRAGIQPQPLAAARAIDRLGLPGQAAGRRREAEHLDLRREDVQHPGDGGGQGHRARHAAERVRASAPSERGDLEADERGQRGQHPDDDSARPGSGVAAGAPPGIPPAISNENTTSISAIEQLSASSTTRADSRTPRTTSTPTAMAATSTISTWPRAPTLDPIADDLADQRVQVERDPGQRGRGQQAVADRPGQRGRERRRRAEALRGQAVHAPGRRHPAGEPGDAARDEQREPGRDDERPHRAAARRAPRRSRASPPWPPTAPRRTPTGRRPRAGRAAAVRGRATGERLRSRKGASHRRIV